MTIDSLFPHDEKPLDNLPADGGFTGIFRRIACVGDSLSSGEFETLNPDGTKNYYDCYDYSWGQYLARMCGTTVYNFSRGGMTAKWYWDTYADEHGFWALEKAAQAYIIALGVNDVIHPRIEFGGIDDIDFDDLNNNKPTFAGYYGRIIQRYMQIQPGAKFFLMTTPREDRRDEEQQRVALRLREFLYELAVKIDGAYVIDLYEHAPLYDADFMRRFFMGGHMNPMGYMLTARMVASYIDYIIRHNTDDFVRIGLVGMKEQPN